MDEPHLGGSGQTSMPPDVEHRRQGAGWLPRTQRDCLDGRTTGREARGRTAGHLAVGVGAPGGGVSVRPAGAPVSFEQRRRRDRTNSDAGSGRAELRSARSYERDRAAGLHSGHLTAGDTERIQVVQRQK
jgi:hypothetical protein